MGFFDWLLGRKREQQPAYTGATTRLNEQRAAYGLGTTPDQLTNEQAIARYRYMIQTAPPEQVEQAHQEAFAKLTPEQRAQVLGEMAQTLPPGETAQLRPGQNDPQTLARLATRAEMRQPGYMEQTFGPQSRYGQGYGGGFGGGGFGGSMMGSLFGAMAFSFAGSMAAMTLFDALDGGLIDTPMDMGGLEEGTDPSAADDSGGGWDSGGDFGDGGGDFGGGDF